MEINVLIDEGLEDSIEVSWLQNIAEQVLIVQRVGSNAELGLVIASEERVRQLNRDYLGKDKPTDVIAFSLLPEPPAQGIPETDLPSFVSPPDGVLHLGEVIISYPQAIIQAKDHRHPVKRELTILIIHGILHLLGYEHDKPALKREMAAREVEILSHLEKDTPHLLE